MSLLQFPAVPPLSLYIHIPWCVRKCPYCDFNSHERGEDMDEYAYAQALIHDLELSLPEVWGRKCYSMFIGGGTPSLLSPRIYDELLSAIRARLPLLPDCEITLEANPGTVEHGRFAEYRACGINRFSLGAQSFDDTCLERLGRIHNAAQTRLAIEELHQAGCDNFNIDLMFGLPGQDPAQVLVDVEQAIAAHPAHISYYQLTLEPNTYFAAHPPQVPDDDVRWRMQETGIARLAEAGYARYEISAYSRAGRQCRHNLNYWTFGDYLGIGAGAHGKLTYGARQEVQRQHKHRHPDAYVQHTLAGTPVAGTRALSAHDLRLEFMMNALRLCDGFAKTTFAERTGQPLSTLSRELALAEQQGLVEITLDRVRPTERGLNFLNDLLALFV